MKVYIAQLKCPNNHCVLGLAGEFESPEAAEVLRETTMAKFLLLVANKQFNHECGLCHSEHLQVQIEATRWSSMAEALPHLLASERDQLATARMLKAGRN